MHASNQYTALVYEIGPVTIQFTDCATLHDFRKIMRVSEEFKECLENLKNLKHSVHLAELAVEEKRMEIHAYICELHPTVWVIYGEKNIQISGLFHTHASATQHFNLMMGYRCGALTLYEILKKKSEFFTLEALVRDLPGMKSLFPHLTAWSTLSSS